MECGAVSKFDTQRNAGIEMVNVIEKNIKTFLRFIRDFILCPKCGLPELKSKIYPKQLKHQCEPADGKEIINQLTKSKISSLKIPQLPSEPRINPNQ